MREFFIGKTSGEAGVYVRRQLTYTLMRQHKRTIRTLSDCFYDLKYHLVWTPKYRGKALGSDKVSGELRRIFETIAKWKHWEIIELSIQEDHIALCLLAMPR